MLALLLSSTAILVDDFAGRHVRERASFWASGNALFTNAWLTPSGQPARIMLRGATWSGLESSGCRLGGAWVEGTPLAAKIEALRRHGFNAIRVPIALSGCPEEADDELEQLITTAGNHGMLVLSALRAARAGSTDDNGYIGACAPLAPHASCVCIMYTAPRPLCGCMRRRCGRLCGGEQALAAPCSSPV
jgi:hypothetical protein